MESPSFRCLKLYRLLCRFIELIVLKMGSSDPQILQATQKLMRLHGLWPEDFSELGSKFMAVKTTIILMIYLITATGCLMHFVHTLATGSAYIPADLIEDCTIMCAGIGFFVMIKVILVKSQQMLDLMMELSDFSKFGKPPTFDEVNKRINYFCYLMYGYGTVAGLVYAGVNLYDKPRCDKEAAELGIEKVCGLLTNTWLPFDIQEFPRYQIYFVIQASTGILFVNTSAIAGTFTLGIVEILLATVTHFKEQLAKTFTYKDEREKRAHLKYCIKYHINIIKNAEGINDIVGNIGVLLLTFTSIVISLIAFQFLLKPAPSTLMHLSGWILVLFVPCFAGQRLIDESSDIPFCVYSTDWYLQDVDVQKCINFMIMRSNRNLSLKVAGFGNLSMESFAAVMQTAYSYMAVLHQSLNS